MEKGTMAKKNELSLWFRIITWVLIPVELMTCMPSVSWAYMKETSSYSRFKEVRTNRNLIQEAGGINLYAYVSNDPINNEDLLGLKPSPNLEHTLRWKEFIINKKNKRVEPHGEKDPHKEKCNKDLALLEELADRLWKDAANEATDSHQYEILYDIFDENKSAYDERCPKGPLSPPMPPVPIRLPETNFRPKPRDDGSHKRWWLMGFGVAVAGVAIVATRNPSAAPFVLRALGLGGATAGLAAILGGGDGPPPPLAGGY